MYRLKLTISPRKGIDEVTLETSGEHKGSIEPLCFYAKLEPQIQKFKKVVQKALTEGMGRKKEKPINEKSID